MIRPRIALLTLALATAAPLALAATDNSIDKVNGSIDAEAGQAYGSLETVNGSIRIGDGARTGTAETVNGSIKAGNDIHSRGLTTVNGSIHLGTHAQVGGDIETVNGGIFVDRGGRVAKDITTVNGAIGLVGTDLAGGIDTVNGDITVGVGSHVHGGIKVEKQNTNWLPIHIGKRTPPRIIIGPDAVVDGSLVFEREVKLYVHDTARIGRVTGATAVRFSGAQPPLD